MNVFGKMLNKLKKGIKRVIGISDDDDDLKVRKHKVKDDKFDAKVKEFKSSVNVDKVVDDTSSIGGLKKTSKGSNESSSIVKPPLKRNAKTVAERKRQERLKEKEKGKDEEKVSKPDEVKDSTDVETEAKIKEDKIETDEEVIQKREDLNLVQDLFNNAISGNEFDPEEFGMKTEEQLKEERRQKRQDKLDNMTDEERKEHEQRKKDAIEKRNKTRLEKLKRIEEDEKNSRAFMNIMEYIFHDSTQGNSSTYDGNELTSNERGLKTQLGMLRNKLNSEIDMRDSEFWEWLETNWETYKLQQFSYGSDPTASFGVTIGFHDYYDVVMKARQDYLLEKGS